MNETPIASQRGAAISPDGRWITYASDESGTYQVYVRAFPDNGSKWQITPEGGMYPMFSRDGRELFIRSLDSGKIFAASYSEKGNTFIAERLKLWLDKPIYNTGLTGTNYDVAPDGKRILVLMPAVSPEAQASQSHVVYLENFFDELRRKVPVGK